MENILEIATELTKLYIKLGIINKNLNKRIKSDKDNFFKSEFHKFLFYYDKAYESFGDWCSVRARKPE